jgi:hypothetical protein
MTVVQRKATVSVSLLHIVPEMQTSLFEGCIANGGPAAASSHLIIAHAHAQFYHHSLQPQLARLAVTGEPAWASCLVAAMRAGAERDWHICHDQSSGR